MGQTVFVTGATGYVARHIVRQLLDAGHKVVGIGPRCGARRRNAHRPCPGAGQ